MTMTASGHHLTQSKLLNGSPCRSPAATSGADGSYSKSTLPSYTSQRLLAGGGGALGSHINDGTTRTNGGIGGNSNNPLLHQSLVRRSSPNSSSQYSQHWRMKKDLGGNCSWKFAAILFMLLSVILVSALSYTTGEPRPAVITAIFWLAEFIVLLSGCNLELTRLISRDLGALVPPNSQVCFRT